MLADIANILFNLYPLRSTAEIFIKKENSMIALIPLEEDRLKLPLNRGGDFICSWSWDLWMLLFSKKF